VANIDDVDVVDGLLLDSVAEDQLRSIFVQV